MTAGRDAVSRTVAAYDRIAGEYLARWRDRRVVERPLAMLATLLPAGALVLDLGCGPGFDGAALRAQGLRVVGADLSWQMVRLGRDHYPGVYLQADMRRLPLAAGTVDGIWASASLLHLPRPLLAPVLAEGRRVLAGEGLFYLSLKEGTGEAWRADACGREAPRFFTYWTAAALDSELRTAGLATVAGWQEEGSRDLWLNRIVRKMSGSGQPGSKGGRRPHRTNLREER